MTVPKSFRTVAQPAEGIYKEKGSKFISYIYPIRDESEVKKYMESLRKLHPKARHLCYAYRFGPDPDYHRQSDDGEPSGSGGLPILSQLKSYGIHNALLVVVRYFGGVLLGSSGLGTAYKLAASDAIDQAGINEYYRYAYFILNYSYAMDNKIKAWIKTLDGIIMNQEYSDKIQSRIAIPKSLETEFISLLETEALQHQWEDRPECQWAGSDLF